MTSKTPSLHLDSGLAIGYTAALATVESTVSLGAGTHFLLARNGRGKSTLLKTIAGSLKRIAGDFSSEGFMQYLPEDMRFDPELTPKVIFKTLLPKSVQADALVLAGRIELDINKLYGQLSTGNRRKTALIMAEYSVKPDCGNIFFSMSLSVGSMPLPGKRLSRCGKIPLKTSFVLFLVIQITTPWLCRVCS